MNISRAILPAGRSPARPGSRPTAHRPKFPKLSRIGLSRRTASPRLGAGDGRRIAPKPQTRYPYWALGFLGSRKAMNLFRTATLLAALCIATGVPAGSSWAQTNSSSPQPATLDASAIGKVMSADGTARIEHAANVVVQANLSAGGVDLAKAGDLVYRGDRPEPTASSASASPTVPPSTSPATPAWKSTSSSTIRKATPIPA